VEVGYALWNHYNGRLLRVLDHFPHALVRFDVDPEVLVAQVLQVCRRTGLKPDRQRIAEWHDAGLVRARADDEILPPAVVEPLWQSLLTRHRAQPSA
jgi:hypothetical protein